MLVPTLEYNGSVITDSKDIIYFISERHPDLNPEHDPDLKRKVDEFVNMFYEAQQAIGGITFNLKPKTPPAPLPNAPPHTNPNDALNKLNELPEFSTTVAEKRNVNEINR
jgi:glutathione S-transferase